MVAVGDSSFLKTAFKLHLTSSYMNFENSTLFDLKNYRIYGRLPFIDNLCKYYEISKEINIPNLAPFLNSWQLFAIYKGMIMIATYSNFLH